MKRFGHASSWAALGQSWQILDRCPRIADLAAELEELNAGKEKGIPPFSDGFFRGPASLSLRPRTFGMRCAYQSSSIHARSFGYLGSTCPEHIIRSLPVATDLVAVYRCRSVWVVSVSDFGGLVVTVPDVTHKTMTNGAKAALPASPSKGMLETDRPEETCTEILEDLEELRVRAGERDQFRDLFQRARADFENYQKRVRREREKERRFQHGPIVLDLLLVLDSLERAIAAAEQAGDNGPLTQGVRLVRKMFLDVLQRHAIAPVQSLGRPFDPNLHHAVMTRVVAGQPANTVVEVIKEGYCLHDQLLRPAEVVVSVSAEAHE